MKLPASLRTFIDFNRWHDPKTGLLGRNALRLALWRTRKQRRALLVGELTGWPEIANTYGHLPGEQALIAGFRAAGAAAPDLARVGWLTFAAVVPMEGARELAESICRAVAETEVLPGHLDRRLGAAIGIDPTSTSAGDRFAYAWRCLGTALERGEPVVIWGEKRESQQEAQAKDALRRLVGPIPETQRAKPHR